MMLGCPFRHWDVGSLKNKLKSLGVTHKGVLEITSKVEGGHYQIACQQLFELTHPVRYHSFSILSFVYYYNRITMATWLWNIPIITILRAESLEQERIM